MVLTIVTGHDDAAVGDTVYIPMDVDTSTPPSEYEPLFWQTGPAFKMRFCDVPRYSQVVPNGNPVVKHHVRMNWHGGTIPEVQAKCRELTGVPDVNACTVWESDGPKEMYVSCDHNDAVWGHEAQHLIDGDYHA